MDEELKKKIETVFVGNYVKLKRRNDFIHEGTITEICGDFILFKTGIASSLINVDDIKSIVISKPKQPSLFEERREF